MNDDAIRAEIHRKAAAKAEATINSLSKSYLTRKQKAEIEGVYQFPSCIMDYSFAALAALLAYPFLHAWISATGLSVVGWLCARFLSSKLIAPLGIVMGGWISTIICLAAAVWAGIDGHLPAAVYPSIAAFGITSFVEAATWMWTLTSGHMNAKYGIAKRMYGVIFPFESEIA